MNVSIAFLICCIAGNTLGYYVQRETPYNTGPNDPYSVEVSPNLLLEPSQRIFWGDGGSNQVGGNDWWSKITNKFPFLRNMFGRIQAEYGVPNPAPVYGPPTRFVPQFYTQNIPQFVPFARDIGFTDDAVIITPPNVPIAPQPLPQPVPQPAPQPGYQYRKPLNRLELPNH
ncbi:uncharacterized protein LOC111004053 [Pieris rapae]|uniref:uncharacterized protein LOC111004053 n=1 Tax=Pieris rapae TaxID=64459 RepID=UPI001E2808DB|nr:uncharacterized protein LOC111004053 [Pieris rapae]